MAIDLHDEFIRDCDSRQFRVKIRSHYQKEDATLLRKEIAMLLSALSGFSFTELQNAHASSSRNSSKNCTKRKGDIKVVTKIKKNQNS